MKPKDRQQWILLIHQLPQKPTSLRVRAWRKLQAIGAISIKNSVYVLPAGEKTNEDFGWLKQEIEAAGGEAAVFRSSSVEGATDEEIIALFRKERGEDYEKLTGEFEGLSGAAREQRKTGSLTASRLGQYETEFGKLRQRLERIAATDFFHAPSGRKARTAFEKCLKELQAAKGGSRDAAAERAANPAKSNVAEYQNRRWFTRKNLHIDRLASGWLIKRFIDRRPRFLFIKEGETVENGIGFDMLGADFTHRGEDCTFETMIKSFGLDDDAALRQIAEIVHDIDLKDDKFNRLEASGVGAIVDGFAKAFPDDPNRLRQSGALFDGLYALFSEEKSKTKN
jgi:hypothetical protein